MGNKVRITYLTPDNRFRRSHGVISKIASNVLVNQTDKQAHVLHQRPIFSTPSRGPTLKTWEELLAYQPRLTSSLSSKQEAYCFDNFPWPLTTEPNLTEDDRWKHRQLMLEEVSQKGVNPGSRWEEGSQWGPLQILSLGVTAIALAVTVVIVLNHQGII